MDDIDTKEVIRQLRNAQENLDMLDKVAMGMWSFSRAKRCIRYALTIVEAHAEREGYDLPKTLTQNNDYSR